MILQVSCYHFVPREKHVLIIPLTIHGTNGIFTYIFMVDFLWFSCRQICQSHGWHGIEYLGKSSESYTQTAPLDLVFLFECNSQKVKPFSKGSKFRLVMLTCRMVYCLIKIWSLRQPSIVINQFATQLSLAESSTQSCCLLTSCKGHFSQLHRVIGLQPLGTGNDWLTLYPWIYISPEIIGK